VNRLTTTVVAVIRQTSLHARFPVQTSTAKVFSGKAHLTVGYLTVNLCVLQYVSAYVAIALVSTPATRCEVEVLA